MITITASPFVKACTREESSSLPKPLDCSKLERIAGVLYVTPPPDEHRHGPAASSLVRLPVRDLDDR